MVRNATSVVGNEMLIVFVSLWFGISTTLVLKRYEMFIGDGLC